MSNKQYKTDLGKIKPLTAEQQKELYQQLKQSNDLKLKYKYVTN